jgi:tripartite-type tricarboxylate transporter receptor subunit TctC
MLRRELLRYGGAMAVAGSLPGSALALDYPIRAARVIVPFPPGGGADITGRLIAQWLSDHLG